MTYLIKNLKNPVFFNCLQLFRVLWNNTQRKVRPQIPQIAAEKSSANIGVNLRTNICEHRRSSADEHLRKSALICGLTSALICVICGLIFVNSE
ncbi:MAG: hypothetical protein LBC20_16125 [Planctomycetaceae bacterium]|jgi:hypothetical protein|nr:hypothetical protein [Planctomycetaceae bacterium]